MLWMQPPTFRWRAKHHRKTHLAICLHLCHISWMSETAVPFFKMNGAGNKIIVADMRGSAAKVTPQAAIALAGDEATHFDQLMAVYDPALTTRDADITILNNDGSEAEACGNGMRCVVSWLAKETGKNSFTFRTAAGKLQAWFADDGQVSVNMGAPRFGWEQIPLSEEFADTTGVELQIGPIDEPVLHTPSVANMGNPHAIFWVDRDVNSFELDRFGPMLENHPLFPERANISIAQLIGKDEFNLRTWERGAGLTLACGSAACATAVSAARTERSGRNVIIHPPSGSTLKIEWRDDNSVVMTGPAEHEFSGQFDPLTGAWEKLTEAVS